MLTRSLFICKQNLCSYYRTVLLRQVDILTDPVAMTTLYVIKQVFRTISCFQCANANNYTKELIMLFYFIYFTHISITFVLDPNLF